MKVNLLIAIFLAAFIFSASAQNTQFRKTDSVFKLVKKFFNAKQADSIYSLAGEQFRKTLSKETFHYVCENQLFPVGEIKESSLLKFVNDHDATYKLTFASATLLLDMNLDSKDKLGLFYFHPEKKEIPEKLKPAATTNPMKTLTDKRVDSAVRPYIQKSNTTGLSIGILKD